MNTMILNKWNYQEHKYKPYNIPSHWQVRIYSKDLDEIINCASCGKEIVIGESYTSLEIHELTYGFGYAVCEECYEHEWERRRKYRNEQMGENQQ